MHGVLYRVKAFNTATASTNKIHDDAVARSLGFRGGLVPGVDVFAYLCHLPAERWGQAWLEAGTISARFASPVYDGDEVEIQGTLDAEETLGLELRDASGTICATATAALAPSNEPLDESIDAWPSGLAPADPPPVSADVLAGAALGSLTVTFHAERAPEYLDDIREGLTLFRDAGLAHPGWLLRFCNYVLSSSVRLGPWIHVSSAVRLLGGLRDGDRLETRARVNRVWEAGGHEFVELDVLQLGGERPVARTTHTAIYHPRGT